METSGRVLTVPLPGDQLSFPGDPYSVTVLRPGYCVPQLDGACRADGTITLITGPRTLLVDTGGPWDRDFLLAALRGRGLEPADVDLVVGTHGHSDHVGNLNLFPSARMIVGYDVSEGDTYLPNKLAEGQVYRVDQHTGFRPEDQITEEVKYMGGLIGGGIMILVPAIHIHLTSSQNCCANRCGMFLSIGFAAAGVVGALYSLSSASLGLVHGPLCEYWNTESKKLEWGRPFYNTSGEYLTDNDVWDMCVKPKNVVKYNVGLFSTLVFAAAVQLVLCLIQMVNGLFGCICGTCGGKE